MSSSYPRVSGQKAIEVNQLPVHDLNFHEDFGLLPRFIGTAPG